MAYASNYPSNSGPPPPPAAYSVGYAAYPTTPAYGGSYGASPFAGAYGQYGSNAYTGQIMMSSAYNVNQYPSFSSGQGPAYGGQMQGYNIPGYSGPQAGSASVAPPPQQPPLSLQYTQMQNMMSNVSMQQAQLQTFKEMGLIEEDEADIEFQLELERKAKMRRRKTQKQLYEDTPETDETEDKVNEEEKKKFEERARRAEEQAKELQQKLADNETLKMELRQKFIDELLRRQIVSGTFEETQGTIFPMLKYEADDPVAIWYNKERGENMVGEEWDPQVDSEYLRKAMRGLGTDEQAIINVISTRSREQRNRCLIEYKTLYGRDLIKDLKSELSGDFRTSILACFETLARYDAYEVKHAIYGAGTDEDALIEILMTRTNEQIKEMVSEYDKITYASQKNPSNSIEKDIIDDTSGDFKRLLISATQGNRKLIERSKLEDAVEEVVHNGVWSGMFRVNYEKLCNVEKCKRMAAELYKAGEAKLGTDEEVFNRIFSTQDYYTLRVVWDAYVKVSQRDILNSIDRETSGDFKRGLRAIAQNIKCRPMFFAERLYKAMKGLGTDDWTLIRIVMSRSEIDLVQIKACFLQQYKQTLWNFIKDDTSGDYRRLLLAIVGKD